MKKPFFRAQAAFRRCGTVGTLSLSRSTWNVKVSSYNLRSLLWAGGATASNKVIEALVGRFARNKFITLEAYLMSMTRLHLAHGNYHNVLEEKKEYQKAKR